MALFDLNRTNDTPIATLKVSEIVPKVWNTPPAAITTTMLTDANANEAKPRHTAASGDFTGGVKGDDVDQATANVALARSDGKANEPDYTSRNQAQKATQTNYGSIGGSGNVIQSGATMVKDVTRPRGYFLPNQAYFPGTPAAPTVTSISPNTAVAGTGNPVYCVITGTNFFNQSKVITGGGVGSPWDADAKWISTTQMSVVIDPRSAVAGAISVAVEDHEVLSNTNINFTFT